MTPTWYDLLGVDRTADAEEIRAAWKQGIADLEPGDRRFDTLNRAGKVLLDPRARADYDASLAPEPEPEPGPEPSPGPGTPAPPIEARGPAPVTGPVDEEQRDGSPQGVPTWLLAGLAVLAVALVAVTSWAWVRGGDASVHEPGVREAQQAAERAVVPVLSYDYRQLQQDQESAQALMTGSYREDYDKLFAVIEENAPRLETEVSAEVVASGIVRASEGRVQVLVFVDRPTTNKEQREPVVYKDQVTLTMQRVDGEWLVDGMVTSPVPE